MHELQHLLGPEGESHVNVSENRFDCYYCIKTSFSRKLWRKCSRKFFFPVPVMAWKCMLPANVMETLHLGQMIHVTSF